MVFDGPRARTAGKLSIIAAIAAFVAAFLTNGVVMAAVMLAAAVVAVVFKRWVALTTVIMLALLPAAVGVTRSLTWVDMKHPVGNPPPEGFPVLLAGRTPSGQTRMLVAYYGDLEEAKKEYVTWSFLVPESELKDSKAEGFSPRGNEMWAPSFSAKQIGPGRQRLEVFGSPDDDVTNQSWYVATDRQITPDFYERYGREHQTSACMAIALVLLLWPPLAIAAILYARSLMRRQNNQA